MTICNKLVSKGREFLLTWGTGVAVGGPRSVLSPHAQVEQNGDQGYTLLPSYSMRSQGNSATYGSWHSFLVPHFPSGNAFLASCYLDQNKIKVTSFDIPNYNACKAHGLSFLRTPWNSFLLHFVCFAIWGLHSTGIFSWLGCTITCSLRAMLTPVSCSVFRERG